MVNCKMATYFYDTVKPKSTKLVVIFDYITQRVGELTVKAGEEVQVLATKNQWVEAQSKDGHTGYIPLAYLAQPNSLEANPWYFPLVYKNEAIELLLKEPPGTYLVRPSSEEKGYALSVRTQYMDKPVAHYKICYHETKGLFIHTNLPNVSLRGLLAYYQNDKENKLNLLQRLQRVCPKSTPRIFQLHPFNLQIDSNEINIVRQISGGNFGIVNMGLYRHFKVAVKELKIPDEHEFKKEMATLRELKHNNVVTFYGYCAVKEWLIFEYVDFCLLGQLKKQVYSGNQLLVIATQVARGMDYIHSRDYLHRDLAARNVLISANLEAKITDFGLSRKLKSSRGSYSCTTNAPTPYLWEALESLTKQVYTKASDVWMFGVLLFEMYSNGSSPFITPDVNMTRDLLIAMLKKGVRLLKVQKMPKDIFDLQQSCMLEKPKKRPSFKQIVMFYNKLDLI